MHILSEYKNGDYNFKLYSDGTLIRETDVDISLAKVNHPSSIDVKITDYCDMGCLYCHESSTKKGLHGNINKLIDIISNLPCGVELAIGGGNPLSHPDLIFFLKSLKEKGLIANLTVNQGHLFSYMDLLKDLIEKDYIKGLGISIINNNFKYTKILSELTNNIVYHIIIGINEINIIDKLMEYNNDSKILILGYKQFGFGANHYDWFIENKIKKWYDQFPKYIGKYNLSFDNLAIEQLDVKRLLTDEAWNRYYMGDDFQFTMYIDAVKEEYAQTSRSNDRVSFNECSLIEYFLNI